MIVVVIIMMIIHFPYRPDSIISPKYAATMLATLTTGNKEDVVIFIKICSLDRKL
jgi:hypothetical protein